MIVSKQFIINMLIVYHDAFLQVENIFQMQLIIYVSYSYNINSTGAEGPIIK